MTTNSISSLDFFGISWTCWKLLGLTVPPEDSTDPRGQLKRFRYILWAILVNAVATLSFPIHLALGILQSESKTMLIDSIAITITSIGAITKFLIVARKQKRIEEMKAVIRVLDARVTHEEELSYYRGRIRLNIVHIKQLYSILYLTIGLSVIGVFLFSKQQRLFYQGWLPFDWRKSWWHYMAAICYQSFGIFFQFLQTFSNDSFAPIALCVLSAHIKLLYKRVARIGHDQESKVGRQLEEQEKELNLCVLDQINLYELYSIIQDIISWPTFVQIFVSVVNNCVAMLALLFFVTDVMDRIYYFTYIMGMWMQLFPTCYYGSDFAQLFEQLHYAVFSCNWVGQSRSFKRHMMIFTERSLRKTIALAGDMFPIHLDTFFATCKGAYSLFAVIMTIK